MPICISSSFETNLEWTQSNYVEGVASGIAREDGPTVTVFGNVHPDERSGAIITTRLLRHLRLARGRIIVVQGNLKAAEEGTRGTVKPDGGEENLNRYFRELTLDRALRSDLSYEERRAQELLPFIDMADAVLDLHEYEAQGAYGQPHIITERLGLDIAQAIGPKAVVFGFAEAEPGGTDGYGYSKGIPSLCAEVGSMDDEFLGRNVRRGSQYLDRFLAITGLTNWSNLRPVNPAVPMLVQVDQNSAYERVGESFEMARKFRAFELLKKGELVAIDGGREIRASTEREQVILFPKPTAPKIGREAFELGYRVAS